MRNIYTVLCIISLCLNALSGMDRFRIKALVKLIKSGMLNEEQLNATMEELKLKCRIYGNGCIKRGKQEEGERYLQLPNNLDTDFENQRQPVELEI